MEYKKIEAADKPIMDRYLLQYGRVHCDANFESMFCPSGKYETEWCVYDGFFILRFISEDKKLTYLQPIGDGDPLQIIPDLEKDANESGSPLIIYGATPAFVRAMRQTYPRWGFAADRRYADYVYLRDDLKNLKGHKYQQKRNHVNKFVSLYDFRFVELEPRIFDDCMALERKWVERKLIEGEGIPQELEESELSDELSYIEYAFRYWDKLALWGGAIYVGDSLVAFSFGSSINDEVFCSQVEKADTDYTGAFAVMNQQMALHLPDNFKYIDREWDSGVPGLRKAKLQYHPAYLSEEVIGRELSDKELQIRDLWLECFPEDDIDFADSFIMNRMDSSAMFSRKVDGHIASALFVIPFCDSAYIYGVMTGKAYRRRGLFGSAFHEALDYCSQNGFKRAVLIPSDESIGSYYMKEGFIGRYHIVFNTHDDFDFGSGDSSRDYGLVLPLNGSPLPEGGELVLEEESSL